LSPSEGDPGGGITAYTDYRAFVRAWLADSRLSMRGFAGRLDVSHSLVSRILAGDRRLDDSRVAGWVRVLGLSEGDAAYFRSLVALDQSADKRARTEARQHVESVQAQQTAERIQAEALRLLRDWHVGAISQLARCEGFRDDPAWIAQTLRPPISVELAAEGLAVLERIGDLVQTEQGLRPSGKSWSTGHKVDRGKLAEAVRARHHDALPQAAQALGEVPGSQRHYGTLMLAVDPEGLASLRQLAGRFCEDAMALGTGQKTPTQVVHVGVQVFPISRSTQ
jgi:uncharacterized protein (TIGR02147 family)